MSFLSDEILPDSNRANFASLVRWARIHSAVFFPRFREGAARDRRFLGQPARSAGDEATEEKVGWALPNSNLGRSARFTRFAPCFESVER